MSPSSLVSSSVSLTTILLAVGTAVKADDIIARIETDKVTVDILAAYSGVITKYHAEEGDTVPVGAPFVDIDASATPGTPAAAAPKKEASPEPTKVGLSIYYYNCDYNRLLNPSKLPLLPLLLPPLPLPLPPRPPALLT